ncbi:signal transduction histidine kinase [Lutibacter sp. Hel_I_33_5]|uniref:ATP-binding protein n=1 Tax=Lutibacter sp. Hel_I_33_5 TaxID=1566289 RepID=UPI0011A80B34|nr:ATP-binding protein [Lutibacter sp. Hel_I_33_5]TVZ55803.1 signal transduction histidine kinase [Lutibacter sp. Hel_I_33_5]
MLINKTSLVVYMYGQNIDSVLIKKYEKADSLFNEKKYEKSIEIATEVLHDAKDKQEKNIYASANYLLAKIWYQTKSYKKAVKYFKKSLMLFSIDENNVSLKEGITSLHDNFKIVENNFKIGVAYHRLLENNDSITFFKDSAVHYYNRVINSGSLKNTVLKLKSKAYSNLSNLHLHDSLFVKAENYANISIDIEKNFTNNFYDLAGAYGNLANIYLFKKDLKRSKQTTLKALKFIENVKGLKIDRYKADLYFNLAYAMYKLEDFKAYEYQQKSYDISDKLGENELRKFVEKISAEKNFEIGKLLGVQQEETKRLKAQQTFWVVGAIATLLILTLLYFLKTYKLKQKNLGLELAQKELIQKRKIEKLRSDSQIRVLNATLDGKSEERKLISETLHDNVSALLSSASMHLQATKKHFNGQTPEEIDKTQVIISEASKKIRDLSHTLVSSILLKFGLRYAVNDIADKYSNSEITFKTSIKNIQRYNEGFEIKTYNIIQELFNNILKHSKATKATIHLEERDNRLFIDVTDNGIGFNKKNIIKKNGLGINQVDARVQVMKGEFFIDSNNKNGTKVTIDVPIIEREPINLL